ncbi:adenylate/guanylate cyclase domain-containing protein [Falsiruegeria mediterranea]|jgi:class 3 adenylate cyclase/ketosteroid isomerase-like protein|uniref:Adenylate cyclase 2 n=1 Tax=Falsiruegeria mediterranea M17 TaxID=1200281 RepID=A0A2R8C7X4_9RHOB|nr:adenylate/guanylate cyclase domain-containing protein [Falsiruegeria mediterranea]SPJ28547.1 Adenylate cyclase 2 [Falsiruegeria mediterranea M17]
MSDPFTPSPELEAVARRFFRAVRQRDGKAMRNLLSRSAKLRFIGTAPNERWSGNSLRDGLEAHFNEAPAFLVDEETHGEAFEAGDIGWAIFERSIELQGNPIPVDFRFTLIFTMEDGAWKILHRHASVGKPNADTHGVEHRALDELAALASTSDLPETHTDIVTVLFTDITDSTTLAATLGDRRWTEIVQRHLTMIEGCVTKHSGQLVKSLGDGTMSVFPSATEALQAAMSIQQTLARGHQEPRLSVRIGVHTGDVVHSGKDFFGTVVNKTARVAAISGPDEIRVSHATRTMVGTAKFTFTEPLSVPLKGLDGEHMIHKLEWQT